ncbi:MAG: acyl-CoA synthetase FdrA [Alphaproteobacteria bacterium]|nr:acyl-CoA synthetase FdrA [Alphaproteobacteria bacterium]
MLIRTEVWPSLYQDSVILMQIAAKVRVRPGIDEAAAFMGTQTNHDLLEEIGLGTDEGRKACPNDVIFTVRADSEEGAIAAIEAARAMVSEKRSDDGGETEVMPRTLDSALRTLPNANLAAISVPGEFAEFEASRAIRRGLNVFLFSDNVPLADEIKLKRDALAKGVLCMGPDCGTAYVSGQGIGFFNVIKKGRVGCIAAAGTGLQAVVSRVGALGEGLSHGIGVGGRDLSADVGGAMTLFALDALAEDAATEVIIIISKPPHPEVMARIETVIQRIEKPVVVGCLGASHNTDGRAAWVSTLDEAADAAVGLLAGKAWSPVAFRDAGAAKAAFNDIQKLKAETPPTVLGLYTGGTLAHETHLLLKDHLKAVNLNGKIDREETVSRIIDLGGDEYTVGRPHPMIAPETRTEIVEKMGDLPNVGVALFDLVIGRGSHEDPARPLVEAFCVARKAAKAAGRNLIGVASVVGTQDDPQDLDGQVAQLAEAGMHLFPSNAEATRFAAMVVNPALADRFLEGSNL